MSFEAEEWLDVAGYEGRYQVSDHGHVRRTARVVEFERGGRLVRRHLPPQQLMTRFSDGLSCVSLWREGKGWQHAVGRLVFETFIRPLRPHEVVKHCNRQNDQNDVWNLYAVQHDSRCEL